MGEIGVVGEHSLPITQYSPKTKFGDPTTFGGNKGEARQCCDCSALRERTEMWSGSVVVQGYTCVLF